ncbi:MAG: aquaporin family protein [Actinobacteria bacterium]|nr:aquaporin family protein [Actinomycetota bacterium]RPH00845.1 MAG: aquaporin family protein [bacterium TMED221]
MKAYLSEYLGTTFLLMIVVGSGIMGQSLSDNDSITLLANTIATGAGLIVLIWTFGKISGAHFNPAVSVVMFANSELSSRNFILYGLLQVSGAISGTLLANYMFGLDALQVSVNSRSGLNLYISEVVATFGLLLVILRVRTVRSELVAPAVGLYITSAYWFTSSTSFANPAVTIGRMFTDTFTGIDPGNVLFFITAQFLGAFLAFGINKILDKPS